MRSAVFYGKHDLRIEDHEMPKVGPKDVLIQVKACGVCGTDVHIYEGDKGAAEVTPPTILGHEFSGVITEVGSEVQHYQVGDRVKKFHVGPHRIGHVITKGETLDVAVKKLHEALDKIHITVEEIK